jgi:hypothetical protein
MGWTFYDTATLPEPGDIVWCKWPYRDNPGQPGPVARPTLVRETFVRQDLHTETTFGSLIISYGTGEFDERHFDLDLVISDMRRARELGLHKPTRFSLDPADRKHLLWCEEFFIAPDYVRERGLVVGRLGEPELQRMKECLARRRI